MKNLARFLVVFSIVLVLAACGDSDNGSDTGDGEDTIELDVALSIDETNILMASYPAFEEAVADLSDGRLALNLVGGPEAVPGDNQGQAVDNGSIDISIISNAYYADLVPEALVINYTQYDYEEELERGAWDYLNEVHAEKMNGILLGRIMPGSYQIYLLDEIESAEDLQGVRLRASSTYVPTLEAYGAEATFLETGEVYQSLERGVLDGFAFTSAGSTDMGVESLINYKVEPTFNTLDVTALMNLDTYNDLPEDLQQVLVDASKVAYEEGQVLYDDFVAEEEAILEENGVETITLSDADEFLETVTEASYDWLEGRVDDFETLEEYWR